MNLFARSFLQHLAGLCLVTCTSLLQVITVSAQSKIATYKEASYPSTSAGRFMKNWLVAGPFTANGTVSPSDSLQQRMFREDLAVSLAAPAPGKAVIPILFQKKEYAWKPLAATTDVIDLDSFYKGKDFAYAYALAEIKAPAASTILLGLGSDDAVKVWLNGKLVHENWIPRGTTIDDDLVPLKLVKGSNQLLLKVQDIQGGWAFVARLLDKDALSEQLVNAANSGNLDKITMLMDGGADINHVNKNGISPIVAAKIGGREDVIKRLLSKGATDLPVPEGDKIIDNFYRSLETQQGPGMALLVARDGEVLYKKGFGYADIKNKKLVTPETKFRIGSVTKQFSAAAILKLQEQNLLSVTDKLSKFIPGYPKGDEVTIHHLLTHTSGIHSYTSKMDFITKVTKTILPDSLIQSFKDDPYDFKPGEKMLYNNSGYFLLGYIIEKVSGKPYAAYLKETFFDPLQMVNTGVHYAGISLQNEALGYSKTAGGYAPATNWDMSWAGAAGALYSTVDDLLKWNQALYNGKVLSKKSLDAALTPAVLTTGERPAMNYGYGLGMNKYRGADIVSHSGGLHGFITQLAYYPADKLTVVMFSNTGEPSVNFDPDKLAEAYLWQKMAKQNSYVESSVKPSDLQRYTGRFQLLNIGVLVISAENNKLFAQLGNQPKLPVFPLAEDEFFWKAVEARLKFGKDEKGNITEATIFQNGQELKGKKLREETIISIDPVLLDKFTGKYKMNDNLIVTISKSNNQLFAKPDNEPMLEMLPVSNNEFVIKQINALVNFVTGENGKVNKFKLNMNGMDTELVRIE